MRNNSFYVFILTFILLGCGNRNNKSVNDVSKEGSISDTIIEERVNCLDSFLNKNNLTIIDIPFSINEAQEKGLKLNDLQKKNLLKSVINFSDNFTAYFLGFVDLKKGIITAKYLVYYYDSMFFFW